MKTNTHNTNTQPQTQGMEILPCLYERCQDCPHWTGTDCDGDLDTEDAQA